MIHKIYSAVLGVAVAVLVYSQLASPSVGTAMFERTKWVGEYFAVGSSEQLTVDSSGNLATSGTITSTDDVATFKSIDHYFLQNTFDTSTTTPWSEVSPAASTTLESFACEFTTSSTTAKQVVMANGAAMQASTTVLASANVGANAAAFVTATTTLASNSNVIGPNTWLNMSMKGGTGVDSPTGACSAVLRTAL